MVKRKKKVAKEFIFTSGRSRVKVIQSDLIAPVSKRDKKRATTVKAKSIFKFEKRKKKRKK